MKIKVYFWAYSIQPVVWDIFSRNMLIIKLNWKADFWRMVVTLNFDILRIAFIAVKLNDAMAGVYEENVPLSFFLRRLATSKSSLSLSFIIWQHNTSLCSLLQFLPEQFHRFGSFWKSFKLNGSSLCLAPHKPDS